MIATEHRRVCEICDNVITEHGNVWKRLASLFDWCKLEQNRLLLLVCEHWTELNILTLQEKRLHGRYVFIYSFSFTTIYHWSSCWFLRLIFALSLQNSFERNSLNSFFFCSKRNSWTNKSRSTEKWNRPSEKWTNNSFLYLKIYGCWCLWLIFNWWLPLIKCIESPLALPFFTRKEMTETSMVRHEKKYNSKTIGTNTHLMITQKMDHH